MQSIMSNGIVRACAGSKDLGEILSRTCMVWVLFCQEAGFQETGGRYGVLGASLYTPFSAHLCLGSAAASSIRLSEPQRVWVASCQINNPLLAEDRRSTPPYLIEMPKIKTDRDGDR